MVTLEELRAQAEALRENSGPSDTARASLAQTRQAAPAAPEDPAFDAAWEQVEARQNAALDATLDVISKRNPDKAAEAVQLAEQFGVDVLTVERNQDEFARQARLRELREATADSPVLRRQLMDPAFAAVAQDDVANLADIERTVLGTLSDVGIALSKGVVMVPQALVGLSDMFSGGRTGRALESMGVRFAETQQILESLYSPAQQAANQKVSQASGFFGTVGAALQNPSTIAMTAIESLPSTFVGGALGRGVVALGGRSVARGAMGPALPGALPRALGLGERGGRLLGAGLGEGVMATGVMAEEVRSQAPDGLLSLKGTAASLAAGVTTGVFGVLGGNLAQRLGVGDIDVAIASGTLTREGVEKGLLRMLAEGGVTEGLLEELPQSATERVWMNLATDRPWNEGVAEAAAMGMLAGGLTGTAFQGVQYIVNRDARAAQTAVARVARLQQVVKLTEATRVRERDPARLEAYIGELATRGGVQNVYIDAQTLMQSGVAEDVAQVLPSVGAQLEEAASLPGGEVAIPIAEFTTRLAGTPLAEALLDDVRIEGEQFTRRQAEEYLQTQSTESKALVEKAMQEAQSNSEFRASYDRLRQTLTDAIAATQWGTGDVHEPYATLIASHVAVRAAQLGTTPEALFAERGQGLRFASELQGPASLVNPAQPRYAGWTPSRIKRLLGAYSNKEQKTDTQAYAAMMSPQDFLNLTASNAAPQATDTEAAQLDPKALAAAEQEIQLDVEPDGNGGFRILNHDGRRRMEALASENIRAVPVVLNLGNVSRGELKRLRKAILMSQADGTATVELQGLEPISFANRAALERLGGGTGGNGDVLFQSLTTQVPTTKAADTMDPAIVKVPGMAEALVDTPKGRAALEKNVAIFDEKVQTVKKKGESVTVRTYDSIVVEGDTPVERAESIINQMVRNLLTIYDRIPEEVRNRSRLWYVGANRISLAFARRYGMSPMQAAAQLAVLSPQADWYMNVSYAERINDILDNQQDYTWDAKMEAWATAWLAKKDKEFKKEAKENRAAARSAQRALQRAVVARDRLQAALEANTPDLQAKIEAAKAAEAAAKKALSETKKAAKKAEDAKAAANAVKRAEAEVAARKRAAKKARAALREAGSAVSKAETAIRKAEADFADKTEKANTPNQNVSVQPKIRGKKLSELQNDFERAWWVRVYDEVHNARTYRVVTPEGGFLDFAKTDTGALDSLAWKAFEPISKAISIRRDGSVANVHDKLGGEHKVRNFYNNIFAPFAPEPFFTADTHQVAANLFLPLGADALEVKQNFGGAGTGNNGDIGLFGPYWLYSEAGARAAQQRSTAERPVLPREMQSISWEAIRLLFTASFKSNAANVNAVRDLWTRYTNGEATYEETIEAVVEFAGGFKDPPWVGVKPSSAAAPEDGATSYESKLPVSHDGLPERGRPARGDGGVPGRALPAGDVASDETLFQEGDAAPARGGYNPRDSIITLLNAADLSTFLHEAAHYFFEADINLAETLLRGRKVEELTPGEQEIVKDVSTLLTWHGIKAADPYEQIMLWQALPFEVKRFHHERTAETFEHYLFTAQAPSLELAPYFRKYRAFLLSAYKSLKRFLTRFPAAGELTPGLRAVFDRMLATSEQISIAEQARSLMPLFENPADYGISPEKFAAYQALGIEASNVAIEELQAKGLRDLRWARRLRVRELRRLRREQAATRAEEEMAARTEVMSQPVYRAWAFLTRPLSEEDMTPEQVEQERFRQASAAYRAAVKARQKARSKAESDARPAAEETIWQASAESQKRRRGTTAEKAAKQAKARTAVLKRDAALVAEEVQKAMAAWDAANPEPQAPAPLQGRGAPRKNRDAVDPTRDSLFVAIAKLGGLNREQVAAQWGVDRKEKVKAPLVGKPVLRAAEGGKSIDYMAEALAELGYLRADENGKWDPHELEELFGDELRGTEHYSWRYDYDAAQPERTTIQWANPMALTAGRFAAEALSDADVASADISKLRKLRMVATQGLHPDVVAEMFGFDSADALIRALLNATPPREAIDALTDQRMLEKYAELSTPEALEEAADRAIHNEVRARFIATELETLAKAMAATEQVGKDRKGRPVKRPLLPRAAREFAANMVSRLRVRDVRPDQYQRAEVRAAKAAEAASKSGDTATALAEKRNQLIQFYAAREARNALEDVKAGVRYLRKFNGKVEGLASDYLEQIQVLLSRFDLSTSLKAGDKRAKLADWLREQLSKGVLPEFAAETFLGPKLMAQYNAAVSALDENGEPVFDTDEARALELARFIDMAEVRPYRDLTVEEFRGLVDSIRQIEHLGRLKNKLLTAQDAREFAAVEAEIADSIESNAGDREVLNREPNSAAARAAAGVRRFGARHIKAATWARIFDGGKLGPMWQYVIRGANAAGDKETEMRAQATLRLTEILAPVLAQGKMGGRGKMFDSINRSLNREQVFALALNLGNAGNIQRLLDGEGWTVAQIQPILAELTKAEWLAVQAVWDYVSSYRDEIAAKERRVYGKEPEWVEPQPLTVVTAEGETLTLRGGYYPIKYDPAASMFAEQHADADTARDLMRGAYTSATTRRSFAKDRAAKVVGRPLLLSLSGLYAGVNEVIHDLSWHEWLIDTNRIMRSPRIDRAIREHYGAEAKQQLKDWISDIATDGNKQAKGEQVFSYIRQSVSAAGLGYNLISAALQVVGFNQSISRVGAKWVAKGFGQFIKHPLKTVSRVHDLSLFMRDRSRTRFRELNELRNRVQDESALMRYIKAGTYLLMLTVQKLVDMPTWLGAYERAMAEGNDEDSAIAMADQMVIDSQGSGMLKDLAGIERGGPGLKLFTVYYMYMNTALNLGVEKTMTRKSQKGSRAKLAAEYLLLFTLPVVMSVALKKGLVPGGDDEEDEEYWNAMARTLAAEQVGYLLGLFVVVREMQWLGSIVFGEDSPRGYEGPAGLRAIPEIQRLSTQVMQGELDSQFRKSVVNLLGLGLGLPAAQINRSWNGVEALVNEETDNPAAVLFGVER